MGKSRLLTEFVKLTLKTCSNDELKLKLENANYISQYVPEG